MIVRTYLIHFIKIIWWPVERRLSRQQWSYLIPMMTITPASSASLNSRRCSSRPSTRSTRPCQSTRRRWTKHSPSTTRIVIIRSPGRSSWRSSRTSSTPPACDWFIHSFGILKIIRSIRAVEGNMKASLLEHPTSTSPSVTADVVYLDGV